MPRRNPTIVTNEVYHVFNRGVEKRKIFLNERDYLHFIETLNHYLAPTNKLSRKIISRPTNNSEDQLLEILCYCLMPNHFHLLLRQKIDFGISNFMSRVQNSFTKYFNTKNDRVGPLFQGPFKAIRIENDEQLFHVSRYIHLNPLIGNLVTDSKKYRWSSYNSYIGLPGEDYPVYINKDFILSYFSSNADYEEFIFDQIEYSKSLKNIKYQLID